MKRGLVLEGGGMRGMFTAGVIDEMMENDIPIDGVVGVSAGATFGCNYKSKQIGRVLRYNVRFKDEPRYMGLRSLLKTGDWVGSEYAYHIMPFEMDPVDFDTYKNNPMEFHVVCTDVDTGEAVYHQLPVIDHQEIDWIRASASLPFVSKPVTIGNRRLLDGGMSDSIPLAYFQNLGYDRNVVVLTQPKGYKKSRPKAMPLFRLLLRNLPVIAEALANRHLMYNRELDYIEEQECLGNTLLIYPEEELPIGRIEQDETKMRRVYQMGRDAAKAKMEEMKSFFSVGMN